MCIYIYIYISNYICIYQVIYIYIHISKHGRQLRSCFNSQYFDTSLIVTCFRCVLIMFGYFCFSPLTDTQTYETR